LDLWVCNETGPSRLYRNKGDGTFEDVAAKAGLGNLPGMWKGCTWFDYDNDGFPDLFLNSMTHPPKLFHNNRNGTFTDVTAEMGINGPEYGLSCWSWDYDNDGWPDIFATCYDRSLGDVVKGLIGEPHTRHTSKLYKNIGGKRFQDVTKEVGLDECFSAMGTNFGDFDNDGFLDIYMGTGDHDIATLVPNRMFRNLGGKRFVDISSSSRTGHLQKGHGVACGDWCRDGNVHIAIQMGGVLPGDRYHNLLFQNPGQGNNWLNVKLVGTKTNRCAIGARIKVVTAGDNPLTVYRYVCSGSSFGGNPLEQMIGVGKAERIATLEIFWPRSGSTQVFREVSVNQALEITEFDTEYKKRAYKPISLPK
jgi:ASPIC and UnbV/FG-GAP-like repeat